MSENANVAPTPFGAVNDKDESLQSKAGGKFGLNTNARITKLEYNPNGGADNAALDAVDVTVQIGDREYRERFFDSSKVFDSKGNELQPGTPEFQKGYNEDMTQKTAAITHIVKATGVTQEQINAAFGQPVGGFKQWVEIMIGLVPADFKEKSVDVFLEYQWSIKGDNDRTYLQLPKNMKGGYFISPAVPCQGEWKTVDGESLTYKDATGKEHPFTRSAAYMDSPKANQIIEGQESDGSAIAGQPQAAGNASGAGW